MTDDLKRRVEKFINFHDKKRAQGSQPYAREREAYKIIKELIEREAILESRIEELEIIIQTALIIGWKQEQLPDDKNMIMLTASELIKNNLDKAKPFKEASKGTYWHKLREAEEREVKLINALRFYANINMEEEFDDGNRAKTTFKELGIE